MSTITSFILRAMTPPFIPAFSSTRISPHLVRLTPTLSHRSSLAYAPYMSGAISHPPNCDSSMSLNRHQLNYQKAIYLLSTVQRLTSVQKFHYLRSSLTIRAARSIQSLDITEINCSIAIGILKEKFDCHLQVCMRHWHLICNYPQITTETPEAVEDFLETIKVNLRALEILGEPVT